MIFNKERCKEHGYIYIYIYPYIYIYILLGSRRDLLSSILKRAILEVDSGDVTNDGDADPCLNDVS